LTIAKPRKSGTLSIGIAFSTYSLENPGRFCSVFVRGKDFVQLKNGPFDLDLIFAPDGIERFEDAWFRRIEVEGFPVCHIDDIIASKIAAHREKDRESLPRLEAFRDYWKLKRGIT